MMETRMTHDQIERAGRLIKILHLVGQPGMDEVAVKLNCGLTYSEMNQAKLWARAFQLAQTEGGLFEQAARLNKEFA
jgi:hypothetical protein